MAALYMSSEGFDLPSLHRNRDNGWYEKLRLGSLPGTFQTVGGSWADFNNDGFLDLLATAALDPAQLHLNIEGREFQDVTTASGLTTPPKKAIGPAWGDFDNDGDLDLFIPYYSDANMLFRNNGDGTFASVEVGSPLREGVNDRGAAWVDYDNDGFLDLFMACGEAKPSPNLLYRNNLPATGNANHWLKVRLIGTTSNRSAIGAKIRVRAVIGGRETWQLRQIASNGSWSSGTELLAHFGLGDATQADTLRIEWPSGIVQEYRQVPGNQALTVQEMPVLASANAEPVRPGQYEMVKGASVTLQAPTEWPGVAYQWQFGGQDIAGANGTTFEMASFQADQIGPYAVVITGLSDPALGAMEVRSRPVRLEMKDRPILVGPAANPSQVSLGARTQISIRVFGTGAFTCQWQKDGQDIPPSANPTATNVTLVLDPVTAADAGSYRVRVSSTVDTVVSSTGSVQVDLTFLKVTGQPIVTDVEASEAGVWCDYDDDGFMDVFVANSSKTSAEVKNSLYHNEGNGTFKRVTNSLTIGANNIWGSAWGDYDNDGHPDLLRVQWGTQPAQLYRGGGAFSFVTTFTLVGEPVDCAWADWDRDGWLDLFIGTWDAAVDLAYRNLGNGTFQRSLTGEVGSLVADATTSASVSFADLDNDGDPDVYVNREDGAPSLHRNLGSGTFEKAALGSLPGTASTVGGVWGDVNNDGFFDLITTGRDGTTARLHLNVEGREFRDVTTTAGLVTPARMAFGPAWGDFDNDADLDLFIPYYSDSNMFFKNNGDTTFTALDVGSPLREGLNDGSAVWVDYDNDGFLDLFVACGEASPSRNLLYRNNLPATGNANHWLKVRLTGTASNRMAIGAKVRVRAMIGGRETWQLRQIASNGAFASGGEFVAHFGLGDATQIETLRIEWPSGIVQDLNNLPVDQFLAVTEARNQPGPPPVVTAYSRAANGAFNATVTCEEPGVRAVLQASTDMVHWAKVMMRTNVTGTIEFTDAPATPARPMRFYRVVVP